MNNKCDLQPVVAFQFECLLGEGPVWDVKRNALCWVDILNGIIHEHSTQDDAHRTIEVGQFIGSIAMCSNGYFLAAMQHGFAFINRENGEIKMINDPESHLPHNRFNEGKCDPAGRFWAGTMGISEETGAGSLYVMQGDLATSKKISGVSVSNGMAWSADHQIFYYIDSPTSEVVAYDYDKTTGHISNRKTIIKVPLEDGFPDGMTIDSEGMLWIAHWDGWQVTRWDPNKGKQLGAIRCPAARITSCTFGGENLQDLYITSARTGLTDEELAKQPLAGSVFVVYDCGYHGLPAFEFNGYGS